MQWTARLAFLLPFLMLGACAGRENPIALQAVQPEEGSPLADLVATRSTTGPLTLFSAVIAQGVPSQVAKKSFEKYDEFVGQVRRTEYIVMIDFTQHSRNKRFYIVNRASGTVEQWAVAHGSGSDPDNNGLAQYFSNVPDSHMSSLGSYIINEIYTSSKFGEAMRLDGLEATNNNVRDRAIVLHPANYVKDGSTLQGLSWGCPAIPYPWIKSALTRFANGTFMYAYGFSKRSAWTEFKQLKQWQMVPKSLWTNESEDAP